jgi:hypothetical protein
MSSKVTYNGKYLEPVQSVSISLDPSRTDAGVRFNNRYNITISGTIIAYKGSPTTSGTFAAVGPDFCETIGENEYANAIMAKRCAIESLFNEDNKELYLGTEVGQNPLTCYPRLINFTLADSTNPVYAPYTIELEADNVYCGGTSIEPTGTSCVRSYSETWDVEFDESLKTNYYGDNRVFKINHTVSAEGSVVADSGGNILDPLDCARNFVCNRVADNALVPDTCVPDFSGCSTKFNYVDVHNIDAIGGSYSITESWVCSSSNYIDDYTIELTQDNKASCPTVSIAGTVTGFDTRINGVIASGDSAYSRAVTHFNSIDHAEILSRAESFTNINLDDDYISRSVSLNPFVGTVGYNYSFKQRPIKRIPSAIWENISLSNNWGEETHSIANILGQGEIIQKLGSIKVLKRSLNIEATFPCSTGFPIDGPRFHPTYATDLQNVVNLYDPYLRSGFDVVAVESQSENWSEADGSYTYSVSWAMQPTGICV